MMSIRLIPLGNSEQSLSTIVFTLVLFILIPYNFSCSVGPSHNSDGTKLFFINSSMILGLVFTCGL